MRGLGVASVGRVRLAGVFTGRISRLFGSVYLFIKSYAITCRGSSC